MEERVIANTTVEVAVESSKIALQILQYLMEHKRFNKELSLYEDTFAKVLRHPEKYAVLKIQGELTNAEELKSIMVDAGMDPDKIITFRSNDQLLCVKAEDKDAFMAFLHNAQQNDVSHGEISFEEDHLISTSAKTIPEDPERFKVSWDGMFQSVDLTRNNKVILRHDSNGEQLLDDWEEINQFVHDHHGVYVQTPYGNMIDREKVHPDGTYDDRDVILIRDQYGNISHEDGSIEYGTNARMALAKFDKGPYRAVMGGFVHEETPEMFIPAMTPGTGDYFNYLANTAVISNVGLPKKDSPDFERAYNERKNAVIERAKEIAADNGEFYLDDDGNFVSEDTGTVVLMADEYGNYRANGKIHVQYGIERADDEGTEETEEKEEEATKEGQEQPQDSSEQQEEAEQGEKEEKKPAKKESAEQESPEEEMEHERSEEVYEEDQQEAVQETAESDQSASEQIQSNEEAQEELKDSERESLPEQEYDLQREVQEEPEYGHEETAPSSAEQEVPSYSEYSEQNSTSEEYSTQEYLEQASETAAPDIEESSSYEDASTSKNEETVSHTEESASYASNADEISHAAGNTTAESYPDQTAESARAQENATTAEHAREAAEAEQAGKIFHETEHYQKAAQEAGVAGAAEYAAGSSAGHYEDTRVNGRQESEPSYSAEMPNQAGTSAEQTAHEQAVQSYQERYSNNDLYKSQETRESSIGGNESFREDPYRKERDGHDDFAEALRNAAPQTTQEQPFSQPFRIGDTGERPNRQYASQPEYKTPEEARAAMPTFNTPPKTEPPASKRTYGASAVQAEHASNGTVRSTQRMNREAMQRASATGSTVNMVSQAGFMEQKKLFSASEIQVAGNSQTTKFKNAVDFSGLQHTALMMYQGLGTEATKSDNTSKTTLQAMHTAAIAYQFTKLRNGAVANTLRDINRQAMGKAFSDGRLNTVNNYMQAHGIKGYSESTFNGKIKQGGKLRYQNTKDFNKSFDKVNKDLVDLLQKQGYIKKGYDGLRFTNINGATIALFGANQTPAQFAQNKKFLKDVIGRQQSQAQFMKSARNARITLVRHFVSLAADSDATMQSMHQGYHIMTTGAKSAKILRDALAADARFTRDRFGLRGRYNRRETAYDNLKKKSIKKDGLSADKFDAKVNQFKPKSKAEIRRMNKHEAKEYERLRKASKQKEWMNAHRERLHAKELQAEKFRSQLKRFNDIPGDFAKRQAKKVVNWGSNTKAGTAVRNFAAKTSSKTTAVMQKVGNTRVGRAGQKIGGTVKKFFRKGNALGARIRQMIQQAIRKAVGLLMKFLFAYVGTIAFMAIFIMLVLVPLSTNFSMFINDQKDMIDEASSVDSIAGTVYSELRYMEIEWASQTRAYGTQKNPIDIEKLHYTDQGFTAEEYLNSEAGINDLLGAYAQEKETGDYGIQGPAPFAGAKLDDYKVIKQVDGGNVFEIEGKPQEGWTSNAKEVISMATVFYSQCVDEVTSDTSEAVSSWQDFWNQAETIFHRIGQWFEAVDFPILGWIAGGTDWSYTGLYRNYAYPLALNSHLENFYLSTYIYPTKWTAPELADSSDEDSSDDDDTSNNATAATHEKSDGHTDARYDTNQEEKTAAPGDVLLNKQWGVSMNVESKHGKLGIGKDGGSGKVDSKNQVSKSLWGSLGDDSYQGFETCSDALGNASDKDIYNGYGCMLRYRFSYKWNGSFGTDEDGNILDEAAVEASGLNKLHYGEADAWNEPNEGDGEGVDEENNNVEFNKTGGDVSADVSPYYKDEDVNRGYQKNDCLVYPLKLSAIAWNCWEETGHDDINMTEGGGYHPEWKLWQKSFDVRNRQKHFTHGDSNWAIDKIVTTNEGFDVYSFRIPRDEDGNILFDEATDATIWHIKHNCTGKHQGVYCGGHAQLRTRGVVYGLSKEQVTDKVTGDDEKAAFDPKYIDPDSEEKESELYGSALDVRNNQITTFNADDLPSVAHSQITEDDEQYVKDARDLYDIDVLISKPKDMYPQTAARTTRAVIKRATEIYLSVIFPGALLGAKAWSALSDAPKATEVSDTTTNTEPWKSWTVTNMNQVAEMISQNWHDMYQVVDTQTIVGGQDGVNSLDDDMMNNVLDQLGWNQLENSIDIGSSGAIENLKKIREQKGPAVVNGKELSIAEEVNLINQLRHLKYAMSLVGNVSYSQAEHSKLWGNLSGHQTDCSGFVSNVWRDALGLTDGYGAMATSGLKAYAGSALKAYTGPDTEGIEPGDIILKNPDDIGGSAHALIYVGKIDPTKLYLDRTATETVEDMNGSGTHEEYKFYNDDRTLKYAGEGETQVYAIDCSTMTITTEAYQDNAPNTLKEFFSSSKMTDGFKKLVGTNYEPNGGVAKVRSGNVRFSAKSYLNDNSAGYDLYYIDMSQLAKDKGVYYSNDGDTLTSIYGTFFDDYSGYQSVDQYENGVYADDHNKIVERINQRKADGTSDAGDDANLAKLEDQKTKGKFKEAANNFWEQDTSIDAELDRRTTVKISNKEGEEERAADDWEVTEPPIPENPNTDDPQNYDDFDWQDYADKLPEGKFKDQLKALIDYYGDSQWAKYYSSGLIKIRKTSDGQLVFYEEQSASWNGQTIAYGTAVAGSDPTNTVARRGCFLYALAAAMTAKTGKIYTVQEVINESGGTLKWNSNGTLKMSGLGTVGGDVNKLLNNASNAGLDASYHGGANVSLSKIDEGLKQGKVYCVWSKNESDPKGVLHNPNSAGMHWTTIIGRTSSGNYIVACNGSRGMEIPPSQMPKYFVSYAEIG